MYIKNSKFLCRHSDEAWDIANWSEWHTQLIKISEEFSVLSLLHTPLFTPTMTLVLSVPIAASSFLFNFFLINLFCRTLTILSASHLYKSIKIRYTYINDFIIFLLKYSIAIPSIFKTFMSFDSSNGKLNFPSPMSLIRSSLKLVLRTFFIILEHFYDAFLVQKQFYCHGLYFYINQLSGHNSLQHSDSS